MDLTRREFLKDVSFAAALVGLPAWAMQMDENPLDAKLAPTSSPYPWTWTPPNELGTGNPIITTLNRTAFGPRPGDFERVQKIGVDAYIEEQLAPEKIDDTPLEQWLDKAYPTLKMNVATLLENYQQGAPVAPVERALRAQRLGELGLKPPQVNGPNEVALDLQEAAIMRAIFSKRQLFETLVDHWSNHFSIFIGKNNVRWLKTIDDREVIRKNALGKFGDLLLASAQSPAMLEYLDNHLNVKGTPNENYAREIMELHTLGVDGGYTQKDVQELARAFTGWSIRPAKRRALGSMDFTDAGTFVFNANQHDQGAKTILGVNLPANGGVNDALKLIDVLANHPSTAKFVTRRLIVRYVSDTPPTDLWARATSTFTQTKGDIRAVLAVILHSEEFKNSFAQKIKRPFEVVTSMARAVDLQLDDARAVNQGLRAMGQGLFMLVTPDGYPDIATSWINTGALLARWNLALTVASGRVPQGKLNLGALTKDAKIKTVGDAVDFWTNAILHRAIPDKDRTKIVNAIGTNANTNFDATRTPDLVALILASPHFQYR